MSELAQAIEEMRNMRESYDQLSSAAEAYNEGKPALAEAITAKGVEAAATDSLATMAEKVMTISQDTYEIDGGEMYAKQLFGSLETPNYWNLYEVLAQLLSDGRLVNYGGILLAEYYKGYDSLALSGAGAGGAYVVSDKDANGNFIMYTNDTTHTWATEDDGKGNRWVAYCFADAGHGFDITDTNTSPRSIFIGRKVGVIKNLVAGRTSNVVVPDGNELVGYNSNGYANEWDKRLVIRNLNGMPSGTILNSPKCESVFISAESLGECKILIGENNPIRSLIISCRHFNGTYITGNGGGSVHNLAYLAIRDTLGGILNFANYLYYIDNVKTIELSCEGIDLRMSSLVRCYATIYLEYLTNDKSKSIILSQYSGTQGWYNIPDVIVQSGWCKPIDIRYCTALTEANMYAHILQRLKQDEADCGDGVTITLGATNLAKLTSQESIDLLDLLTNTYGYTFA